MPGYAVKERWVESKLLRPDSRPEDVKAAAREVSTRNSPPPPPAGWVWPREEEAIEVEVADERGAVSWQQVGAAGFESERNRRETTRNCQVTTGLKSSVATMQPPRNRHAAAMQPPCNRHVTDRRRGAEPAAHVWSPAAGRPKWPPVSCLSPLYVRQAQVIAVLVDGYFQARISTKNDSWEDWFTWQEEGIDWRRKGKRAPKG